MPVAQGLQGDDAWPNIRNVRCDWVFRNKHQYFQAYIYPGKRRSLHRNGADTRAMEARNRH